MNPRDEDWLALTLVEDVGQKTIRRLLDAFGGIVPLLAAAPDQICRASGVRPEIAARISRARNVQAFQTEKRLVGERGISLISIEDERYPDLLRQIAVPPPLLYCRGEVPFPAGLYLSVVGTRRCTQYGKTATRRLVADLAALVPDLVIVSGLARGIDTVAHEQALASGAKTIAVLAGGLCDIYPPENRELAERIADQGTLVTEFPMAVPPLAKNFPIRNRVISGFTAGTVVTEAGEKSGALITAGFALHHNREVFAVPGNIDLPHHAGTNRLIQRNQAKLVRDATDILDELAIAHPPRPMQLDWLSPTDGEAAAVGAAPLSEDKRKVVEMLRDAPLHPDDLSEAVAMPVEKLLSLLLELELSGEICQTSDNQYGIP